MYFIDWLVIALYMVGMIGMSVYLGRSQKDGKDYYLGGNDLSYWSIGISTMATQCSTNSLLGAPAFVIATGGLLWLQYEIAVPLAMICVMIFLLPFFRKHNVVSVYEYLESRFDVATRTTLSVMFQFLRAFATGVTVYGISMVLESLTGMPFWVAVLTLGVVTVIYDYFGGMKAVVLSDVIQMILLYGGITLCLYYAISMLGGFSAMWQSFPVERGQAIDFRHHGFGDGKSFAFWPMLFGGLFLYVSYYGCDQTQVQRELSSKNIDDTNMSLFINGMLRFPLVLTYCLLGVALAAFISVKPEFLHTIPLQKTTAVHDSIKLTNTSFLNSTSFVNQIKKSKDLPAVYLKEHMATDTQKMLQEYKSGEPSKDLINNLARDLNKLMKSDSFYQKEKFDKATLTEESKRSAGRKMKPEQVQRSNRWLLEDTFNGQIKKTPRPNYNMTVPQFVLTYLPHGIIGLIFVALFAAAMSSLDSTINSLSATTIRDIVERFWLQEELSEKKQLLWSRITTIFWGAVCTIFSFFVGGISQSIIESINKISSLASGPILATFMLAILTRKAHGKGVIIGIIMGFLTNLYLWIYQPEISWLWWNVIGCLVTFTVGYGISLLLPAPKKDIEDLVYHKDSRKFFDFQRNWPVYYVILAGYSVVIIAVCYGISTLKN